MIMFIAVMSDSHNNMKNIKRSLEIIKEKKTDAIIHCGDLTHPSVVKKLLEPGIPLFITLGNMDDKVLLTKKFLGTKNIWIYDDYGEIKSGEILISFTHFPHIATHLAETGKYEMIFYGHTHIADETIIENTKLVNPGDIEGRNGNASFLFYETEKGIFNEIEIK